MLMQPSSPPGDLWSWINANGGAISTIATVVTALVAIGALLAAARDSRERARPYITVELAPAPLSGFSAVLRVVNSGQTVARDVVLKFEPELTPREPKPGSNDAIRSVARRYSEPIPNLSPGQALTNTWQTWTDHGVLSSAPERCTVAVSYRSGRRVIRESFILDTRTVSSESDPVASNSELGSIRRVAVSLEAIKQSMAELARRP
ncbi:hypothetical protein [Cellulomonas sp.]|uniref:hypothetical protein n=1 Tax=Cellulomonas sp. TaxID=40001 RepID=UPI001B1CBC69|nr:hypothetical protein [Cellulomonas sp.]MBO9555582.1 hypothetical protein [Cellulomonas sp.]